MPFMRGARAAGLVLGRVVLGFVIGVDLTGRCAEWEVPRGRVEITGVDIVREPKKCVDVAAWL
jgi:hypothetical protein